MGMSPPTPKIPQPPMQFPIDIPAAMRAAMQATDFGYALSDKDFATRFPGLVSTREEELNQALTDMTTINPVTQSEMVKRGAGQVYGAFGGGSESGVNLDPGSIGRNTLATSVAGQTRQFQDNARATVENLMANNPERQFISGADAANIAIRNNAVLNQANQNAYLAKIQQQNAASGASAAGTSSAIGAGASIIGAILPLVASV